MGIMVVKTYKSLGGRSSTGQWSNSYEIETENAIGSPELDAEVDKLVAFERSIHTAAVHFMSVVVSTWEKEGRTGHPEAVRVRELAGTGAATGTVGTESQQNVLPAEIVLEVKRIAATGRTGRLLYRGAVREDMAQTMGNGNMALQVTAAGALQDLVDAFNEDASKPNLILASYDASGNTLTRPVTRLEIGSIIVRKRTARRKKRGSADTEDSALDYLDEALGIAGAAAAFLLTKNPQLSAAARAGAIAVSSSLGTLVGNLIQSLTVDPVGGDGGS